MTDIRSQKAMASLEEMADAWARGSGLTRAVSVILTKGDHESRLEGLVKCAWMEGAYAALKRMTPDEIEQFAKRKSQ